MATELNTVEGSIKKKNDKGLTFDGKQWFNYTQYRDEPFVDHAEGDNVRLFLDKGGKFIQDLAVIEQGHGAPQSNGHSAEPRPSQTVNGDQWAAKWSLDAAVKFYETRSGTADDVIDTALKFTGLFRA